MTRCNRSDCTGGVIDVMGYCETCGRRSEPLPAAAAVPPPVSGPLTPQGPWQGRDAVIEEKPGDPEPLLLGSAQVPLDWRYCERCGAESGRHGRDRGRCPRCGEPFDFTPRLREGDVVDGRYLVKGVLSHGSFGWAYLASDTELNHPVILKGVIRKQAAATLERERQLLADLDHPYIVRIWGFISDGNYLVTDYAGGTTLRPLAQDEPLAPALYLVLQLLEALDYLHGRGLLHCDVKLGNIVRRGDRIRLIDFGSVRTFEDDSPVSGGYTEYFAPPPGDQEREHPTAGFDLYCVGKTLQSLCREHMAPRSARPGTLSLRLLAERATHREPARRFVSARQFADQFRGVIQQVIERPENARRSVVFASMTDALDGGLGEVLPLEGWVQARRSGRRMVEVLESPFRCPPPQEVAAALPSVLPDPFQTRDAGNASVVEANLDACHAAIRQGDPAAAQDVLKASGLTSADWRSQWYGGLVSLARGDVAGAVGAFQDVRTAVPGEVMPLLALGLCDEHRKKGGSAGQFYQDASGADQSVVASHFGLARVLLETGHRADAVSVLERVPDASRFAGAARIAMIRSLSAVVAHEPPDATEAERARALAQATHLDEISVALMAAEAAYADAVRESAGGEPSDDVRSTLDRLLRALAGYTSGPARTALVDLANFVRPVTIWSW